MTSPEWLDAEPDFDFPIGVDRAAVKDALDTVPSARDRETLAKAIDGAAAAYRALRTDVRDQRATHRVAMRELGSAVERIAALVGQPDANPTELRAELEWARRLAKDAIGDES